MAHSPATDLKRAARCGRHQPAATSAAGTVRTGVVKKKVGFAARHWVWSLPKTAAASMTGNPDPMARNRRLNTLQ